MRRSPAVKVHLRATGESELTNSHRGPQVRRVWEEEKKGGRSSREWHVQPKVSRSEDILRALLHTKRPCCFLCHLWTLLHFAFFFSLWVFLFMYPNSPWCAFMLVYPLRDLMHEIMRKYTKVSFFNTIRLLKRFKGFKLKFYVLHTLALSVPRRLKCITTLFGKKIKK